MSDPVDRSPTRAVADRPWAPCSDASRRRCDPLWATAGRGERWFLIEVAAAWGPHAFLDEPFDPALGRRLVQRIEAAGIRPLAIRRPGRRDGRRRWRWAAVHTVPGSESVRWGEVDDPTDLLDVDLLGATGIPSSEPVFAVCAHGRHDRCCAVRGRRAAQRLASSFPDQTWECSHLGGDRFAATMAVFPHGLVYGRIDDGDVVDIAEGHLAGRVEEGRLRGRAAFSHAVQAAQHFARLAYGDDRIDAYPPRDEYSDGEVHTVRLVGDAAVITVELRATRSPELLSTCAATLPTRTRQWELLRIRRMPPTDPLDQPAGVA